MNNLIFSYFNDPYPLW